MTKLVSKNWQGCQFQKWHGGRWFQTETTFFASKKRRCQKYTWKYIFEQNYFNDSALETRPGVYRGKTVAVGSFSANPNGLYDIYGNVGEWCFDFYGDYGTAAQTNPTGAAAGTRRVNRGA